MLSALQTSTCFAFVLLLCVFSLSLSSVNTLSLHSAPKLQLCVFCENPKTRWCLTWLVPKEKNHVSRKLHDDYKLPQFCDLGYLELVNTNENLYKVNSVTPKTFHCENIEFMAGQFNNKEFEELMQGVRRRRRRYTPYQPRGRYRGQTQSQYLAIGNDHGKDDGKAEAHSDADSSRASVSGSTGMGQAQSQTIYDPSCDECLGRGRTPGVDGSGYGTDGQWPSTGGRVPGIDQTGGGGDSRWPSTGGRVPGIDGTGAGGDSRWPGTGGTVPGIDGTGTGGDSRRPSTGGRVPGIDQTGGGGDSRWPSTGGRVPGIDQTGGGGDSRWPSTGGRVPGIDGSGGDGDSRWPSTGGRVPGIDGTGAGSDSRWPGTGGTVPGIDGTGTGGDSRRPSTGGRVPGIDQTGGGGDSRWPSTGGRVPGIDGTGAGGDSRWPGTGGRVPGIDGTVAGGDSRWPSTGGRVPGIDGTGTGGDRRWPSTGGRVPGIDQNGGGGDSRWPSTGGTVPGIDGTGAGSDSRRPGTGGTVPGIDGTGTGGDSRWPSTGGRVPGINQNGGGDSRWPSSGGRVPGIDGTGAGSDSRWPGTGRRVPGIDGTGAGDDNRWPSTGGRVPGIDGTGTGGDSRWPSTGGRVPGIDQTGGGGDSRWPNTGGRVPGTGGTGPVGDGVDATTPGGEIQWPGTGGHEPKNPSGHSPDYPPPNTLWDRKPAGNNESITGQWPPNQPVQPSGPPPNYSPLYPTWQSNVTVPGWPLFPGSFPQGSTYYCCVVSPGNNGQNGISNTSPNVGNLSPTIQNSQRPELQNQMRPNPQTGQYAPNYNTWPNQQDSGRQYGPDSQSFGGQFGSDSRPNTQSSNGQYRPQDKYGTDSLRPSIHGSGGQNGPEYNARPNVQDYGGQYGPNYNARPNFGNDGRNDPNAIPNSRDSSGYYRPDYQSAPNPPSLSSQYGPDVQGRPNSQTGPGLRPHTQSSEGLYNPQSTGGKYSPNYNVQGSGQNSPNYNRKPNSQDFSGQYGPSFNSKPNFTGPNEHNGPEYNIRPNTQVGTHGLSGPNYNTGPYTQELGGRFGPDNSATPNSQSSGGNNGPQSRQSNPDYNTGPYSQSFGGKYHPQSNDGQYGPNYNTGPNSPTFDGKSGPQSSSGQYGPDFNKGLNSQGAQYFPQGAQYFPQGNVGQHDPNYISSPNYQGPNAPARPTGGDNGNGLNSPELYNTVAAGPQNLTSDDSASAAEASVAQTSNGTTATANSRGGNKKGSAQTNVQGTYTGSGSFSAQAEITDENKGAQSSVEGGKKGSKSSAQGNAQDHLSLASVQLGSETGSLQTLAESSGKMHSSNSKVQGSVKGGMADAQARGPGITSSQAQIGFTPYKEGDKSHDILASPFMGQGTAAAQSSSQSGQSQSNLQGKYKYGISYNGAAQAGASIDKDAVFSKRLPFNPIDVFSETDKTINVNAVNPPDTILANNFASNGNADKGKNETMNKSETRYSAKKHTHLDHHKSDNSKGTPALDSPVGSRRSFQTSYDNNTDYEYTTERDEIVDDFYHDSGDLGLDGTDVGQTEYTNYDDLARESDSTHQLLQSNKRKGLDVKQTTGGNTQHIVLGSLTDHDADITQRNSERPDENRIYQQGESVPGTGGYTIPIGFTGSVKSVASKDKTYVVGSKSSPSQAQTVSLSPGTGKVRYTPPRSYGKNIDPKSLKSLHNPKKDENNRYVSVSKSVTRDLDGDNNIRKQYSHTYYTKSSSCGYFTFTCTMVSGVDGMKKICKPKIPTNPDGTPMRC